MEFDIDEGEEGTLPVVPSRDLHAIREEWLAVGLNTSPADRERAEAGADLIYRDLGFEPPSQKIWFDSPFPDPRKTRDDLMVAHFLEARKAKIIRPFNAQVSCLKFRPVLDKVFRWLSSRTCDQVACLPGGFGQFDADWLACYEAFDGVVPQVARAKGFMELARSCGWWVPCRYAVLLADRPREIHHDVRFRLHNKRHPALVYANGVSLSFRHGQLTSRNLINLGVN